MPTTKHHPAPAPQNGGALELAKGKMAWVIREALLMLEQSGIDRKMLPDDIKRVQEKFLLRINAALVHADPRSLPELIVKHYRETGVDLDDRRILRLAHGEARGVLKENEIDVGVPGADPANVPTTVYVPKPPDQARRAAAQKQEIERISRQLPAIKPAASAAKPVTHEGVPPLWPRQKTPEAAKTPLTAMRLPTQPLPPAPELPAKDPRRSSAQLPSIRREPTVEKAFQSAAALLRSRYPEGTFPSMADFLAEAYNDQEPNPEKNARRKLEKWTRQFWTGSDEEKSSPNFEREIEKAFLAGFGDRYCKQQHRDRTEAVKKRK